MSANPIHIVVNGEPLTLQGPSTVSELVASRNLRGPVAVERNEVLIPRAHHAHTLIHDGDRIEIVSFVGGG
ncbi:MAG: sulfur carrier protein ThiS [Deltaproteobacteria bacterium]|nr:sulfur carrier protein ThiS [Deltaproteobacteria bacterium]